MVFHFQYRVTMNEETFNEVVGTTATDLKIFYLLER